MPVGGGDASRVGCEGMERCQDGGGGGLLDPRGGLLAAVAVNAAEPLATARAGHVDRAREPGTVADEREAQLLIGGAERDLRVLQLDVAPVDQGNDALDPIDIAGRGFLGRLGAGGGDALGPGRSTGVAWLTGCVRPAGTMRTADPQRTAWSCCRSESQPWSVQWPHHTVGLPVSSSRTTADPISFRRAIALVAAASVG